jgi:hypothetical protein
MRSEIFSLIEPPPTAPRVTGVCHGPVNTSEIICPHDDRSSVRRDIGNRLVQLGAYIVV